MVFDTARAKYKENTIWPGMFRRDAARKSTPKVNIIEVLTMDFSEIQFFVNHNSQSNGQNKSAKNDMNLEKEDHIYPLTPEEKRRYQGYWYLTLNKEGKNGPMKLRSDFPAADSMKKSLAPRIRRTNRRAHPSTSTKTITKRIRSFLRRLLLQRSS